MEIWFGIAIGQILLVFDISIFLFPYNDLCKNQWIFTTWFGIFNGQILSVFDSYLPMTHPDINFSKCQWSFTKLAICIDIVEVYFGKVNEQISSTFDTVICPGCDSGGVLLSIRYTYIRESIG